MELKELIQRLKPYPVLLSILLEAITDEEYEAYVDSLPDEPEDKIEPTEEFWKEVADALGLSLEDVLSKAQEEHEDPSDQH